MPSITYKDQDVRRKELQENWMIPCIAQFVSLFREGFKLPEIEIEDLEEGLVDDSCVQHKILVELLISLIRGINPKARSNNWENYLKKIVQKRFVAEGGKCDPYSADSKVDESELKTDCDSNTVDQEEDSLDKIIGFLDKQDSEINKSNSDFWKFDSSVQAEIIYSLCLMRLDRSDAVEAMKKIDADALRGYPLGFDDDGNEYWYFYGTRLYKQEPAPRKNKSWEEDWQELKEKTFKKRRPGRPPKKLPSKSKKSDGESDEVEEERNNRRFMNIDEKSRWSVACHTLEDWINFADRFKDSKSKCEKALFEVIQENFLPALSEIYEEKEKRLKQKLKEMIPKRIPAVTRRETRNHHKTATQHIVELADLLNNSQKEDVKVDRARRLEERNRRTSERLSRSTRNKDNYYCEDSDEIPDDPMETSNDDYYVQEYYPLYSDEGVDIKPAVMKLISEVKVHKDAWNFINPVKKEEAPGYYEMISQPIDLSIITQKLLDGHYQNISNLDADFRKLVLNCRLYNGENSAPTRMINNVYKLFQMGLDKIYEEHGISQKRASKIFSSKATLTKFSHTKSRMTHDGKRKKKKVSHMDAIEILSREAELSIKKYNNNKYFENLQTSDIQQNSRFSDLKIVPIHSNPTEIVERFTSDSSNQDEDIENNESSYMEEENENSGENFELGNNSDSLASPSDYGYFLSSNKGDNSNDCVFADKDSSNSQEEERRSSQNNSPDHQARISKCNSPEEVCHSTSKASTSSSEGLIHGMANILDERGNQNVSPRFNRELAHSANETSPYTLNKSPNSHPSDSSTPDQTRSPKDPAPFNQNSVVEKNVPFLQHGLNIPTDFGNFLSSEQSTVDASVLGFSSFSSVPSRISPLSYAQSEHKQASPPIPLSSSVASITTQPSTMSRVVASSSMPSPVQVNSTFEKIFPYQNPVQLLKPEPNKFPTVKVNLPPSTGNILFVPDKSDPNKMTLHLLAQPHANGSPPIQSSYEIRASTSSESSENERENSSLTAPKRKSPMVVTTPNPAVSNGNCVISQPQMVSSYSNFLKPTSTFSSIAPNSSVASSYASSFNPVSTGASNSVPINQPAYQFVRPSSFNAISANHNEAIRPSNALNLNFENVNTVPQTGNIFRMMNSSANSMTPNYQMPSNNTETKAKVVSTISKKVSSNVQKVTEVTASNNIMFSSSTMLSSNGQCDVISVPKIDTSQGPERSINQNIKSFPEGSATSYLPSAFANPMQNYTYTSTPMTTSLVYAQVNPNQPPQLISIPNYMIANQNMFQHPLNPSMLNIQPFQVPTRPLISMNLSHR